jgi:hypothetical protein
MECGNEYKRHSSPLKMEAAGSLKMLTPVYQTTWCHPRDLNLGTAMRTSNLFSIRMFQTYFSYLTSKQVLGRAHKDCFTIAQTSSPYKSNFANVVVM